ncbi:MAG: hypothetical protein OSA08_07470 [Arenicellales bacterium]|jgi:hypothetical protein|nr:hypothetical protein [Arenicellales bacterium]|tara:strand:- start:207 stop:329 length:123 start_codon:yes stop_codon:yes gene_type:complete
MMQTIGDSDICRALSAAMVFPNDLACFFGIAIAYAWVSVG